MFESCTQNNKDCVSGGKEIFRKSWMRTSSFSSKNKIKTRVKKHLSLNCALWILRHEINVGNYIITGNYAMNSKSIQTASEQRSYLKNNNNNSETPYAATWIKKISTVLFLRLDVVDRTSGLAELFLGWGCSFLYMLLEMFHRPFTVI